MRYIRDKDDLYKMLQDTIVKQYTEEEENKRKADFKCVVEGNEVLKNTISNLEKMGYFVCPAGCKHHGNYIGGLYDHSLAVTDKLLEYTDLLDLKWERKESPVIIGMLHDLCKVLQYRITVNGTDIKVDWNKENCYPGHGELSLQIAVDLIELTEEEKMCIRYHMGAYEGNQVWQSLDCAIKKYPNILYVHLADMYASKIIGK